jgi:membrane protein implicated in regulation of membrane protease activity
VASSRGRLLVLGKYLLLQLPGWALVSAAAWAAHHWLGLGPWLAVGAVAVWVLKDLALYPFVRHAYEVEPRRPGEHLEGRVAVAEDDLAPGGFVRLDHELWRARLAPGSAPVARGERVRVETVEGLSLRVRAESEGADEVGDTRGRRRG